MRGFDYGIVSNIMAVSDPSFLELWDEAGYTANGYGIWPEYEGIYDIPFLSMIFENETKGREIFSRFSRWCSESKTSRAIGITFLELNKGGYMTIFYPEAHSLVKRLFPNMIEDRDVRIMPVIYSKAKEFPQKSVSYNTFKETVKNSGKFLFIGGTYSNAFDDLFILKEDIEFVKENEVDRHSMAHPFISDKNTQNYNDETDNIIEPINEIFTRRSRNLAKYFPVTLERLRISERYQEVARALVNGGYQVWQIRQAICNLVLSYNVYSNYHFVSIGRDDQSEGVYTALQQYFEKPSMPEMLISTLKPSHIRKQIELDSIELLEYRKVKLPNDCNSSKIQRLLKNKSLL